MSAQTVAVPALAAATTVLVARQAANKWLEHWYRESVTELSDPEASDWTCRVVLKLWQQRHAGSSAAPPRALAQKAKQAGQAHIFECWEDLSGDEQQQLAQHIEVSSVQLQPTWCCIGISMVTRVPLVQALDFRQLQAHFERSKQAHETSEVQPAATEDVLSRNDIQASEEQLRSAGLQLLSQVGPSS